MDSQPTTILMLSANPRGTEPLRLDEERREIEAGLERSRLRDQFRLITKVAVRPRDFQRAMLEYSPQIIHFRGHGGGDQGLYLEDETGQVKLVSADALAALFELFADRLHCVVLNACYAEVQAKAIVQHIPYTIGMSDQIGDRAAIEFAVAFYDALGAGRDVEFAYKSACVAIQLAGIAQAHIPVLHRKDNLQIPPSQGMPRSSPSHNLTERQVSLLKWFVDEVRAGRLKDEILLVFEKGGKLRIKNYKGSNSPPEIFETTLKILENSSCIVYIPTVLPTLKQVRGLCVDDFKREVKLKACRITLTRQAYEIVDSSFRHSATPSADPIQSLSESPDALYKSMTSGKQQLGDQHADMTQDWQAILEKALNNQATHDELTALKNAFASNVLSIASGDRAISTGGNMSGLAISGNQNVVHHTVVNLNHQEQSMSLSPQDLATLKTLLSPQPNPTQEQSVHPPSSPSTPPEPMTSFKRQRLEQEHADLLVVWNTKREQVKRLKEAFAIEAGVNIKFQLEKQVQIAEEELSQLKTKLEAIEQALEPPKK